MKYKVSTSAMSASITTLQNETHVVPRVFYAPGVWERIQYLVSKCTKEVGWLGLVEKINNDYLITEIFVPEQTVTGAETDISSTAMAALAMQLLRENKDPSKLRYWGHSHVNMSVSPSTTDENQVAEYLETCNYFIRGIYNKSNASKVDVYDRDRGVAYQCVAESNCYLTQEVIAELDKMIADNVKEQTYAQNTYMTTHTHTHEKKSTHGNYGKSQTGTTTNTIYVIGKGAKEYVEALRKAS